MQIRFYFSVKKCAAGRGLQQVVFASPSFCNNPSHELVAEKAVDFLFTGI